MKKIIVSVFAACLAGVTFAQAKPAAKTSPTPTAAKKAPPLEDAGEWKPLDNKKGHLCGPKLTEGDIFFQPVIVIVFDPQWHPEPKVKEEESYKFVRLQGNASTARFQYVFTPFRDLASDEQGTFEKDFPKTWGGGPCYANFGLEKPPANKEGKYPFFYAVSISKKIIYSGYRFDQALARVMQNIRMYKDIDDMLGFYRPRLLADTVADLKFGQPIGKVVQKLKPIAASRKPSDEKTEAESILKVLDQSKSYWTRVCAHTVGSKPMLGAIMCNNAMKTFAGPKDKEAFKKLATDVESKVGKQTIKLYQTLYAYKEKLPEKKADIKKALADVKKGEQLIAKAKKQSGDQIPSALMTLDDLLQELKGNLEGALEEAK